MSALSLSHRHLRIAALLLFFVTLSALAVVHTSFKNRQLFIELQALQLEATQQKIKLGRLLIEESTWSSLAAIEHTASTQLSMTVPRPEQLVVVSTLSPQGER
ncbi:MAG: cell division protein FtsL [Pseudomonadales bacterium]|nr:cell division protein FtsL [Pseudomonadales bacterium]